MNFSLTCHPTKVLRKKSIIPLVITITACCISSNAMAMTVPAAGSFAYDLYDIGVNQILLGPIGFVAGVACMVFAAILAIRQMILPAAGVVLGGAFLLKADAVVQTIGATIM
ncbi:hypothetical protein [Desulfogranum marinum]|uniref:hypothetical protein n=1 Tax=Desulfogranum marinum TaxID=453220 RepID=UPI0029C8875E|nr:hypothetical protein [Desulfogranum marinum]